MIDWAKQAWTNALRFGHFTQAQGALHAVDTGYCCLGVLVETLGVAQSVRLLNELGIKLTWERQPGACNERLIVDIDGQRYYHTTTLDGELSKKLGLNPDQVDDLIDMNDRQDKNFNDIATWIEENL